MALIWHKFNDDSHMTALLPFTAKKEGDKWVIYCAEGKAIGVCSKGAADDFNNLAADKEHWKTTQDGNS